jgi:hypothetical protein
VRLTEAIAGIAIVDFCVPASLPQPGTNSWELHGIAFPRGFGSAVATFTTVPRAFPAILVYSLVRVIGVADDSQKQRSGIHQYHHVVLAT